MPSSGPMALPALRRSSDAFACASASGAIAVRQAADRLRLADAALVQEAGGLDPAELRHRHEHVEDLRGRDVLGRIVEDLLDAGRAALEVLLQLRPAHADVVRPLECFHSLVERAEWRLGLSLESGHGGGS